jgi:cytochrome c oxidase subunit 1
MKKWLFILILSILIGTILSFLIWAHNMFVTGLNPFLGSAFVLLTLLIAVPLAIKVFNWLTTLWKGYIRFTPAMFFAIGSLSMFISGVLTRILFHI